MKEYLVFRLYGPIVSWGDIAVGEERPTFMHPTKSSILGLLAAALGIRRNEESRHHQLAESYGYAVLVEAEGILLRDYHTTQVAPGGIRKKQKVFQYTKRGVVWAESESQNNSFNT